MSDHEDRCKNGCEHDHGAGTELTRRGAARHLLNTAMMIGAAVVGLQTLPGKAKGWGQCEVNGCGCLGFMGNGANCQNCGHLYTWHAN
jgi:hypothetical protein